jgi:quinolinate synthase
MLWQPSIPERYTKATPADLARDISERRRELGEKLFILGHHYQTDEVIQHADVTGDSLKLSQIAAEVAKTRPVEYVIFCGVHFMAESADMLTPEHVQVILPDLSAGCSMADMAQYDDTVQAWNDLHAALEAQGWRGTIVPVTYVNSSAAIKAFVGEHGGSCCTSSNADKVFAWARAGGEREGTQARRHAGTEGVEGGAGAKSDVKVLFLPDQHLGRNTAHKLGVDVARHSCLYDPRRASKGEALAGLSPEQVLKSEVILWAGHCSVHKLFRPEHGEQIRKINQEEAARSAGEGVQPWKILVHPECAKEVVDQADLAGSTEFIIQTIRQSPAGSRWAVGTEVHLVNRLAQEAKQRSVEVRILSDCQCLCTTMYRIDQPHLLWVLDNLTGRLSKDGKPRVVNQIKVHPKVREQALWSLDRMLKLSKQPVMVD